MLPRQVPAVPRGVTLLTAYGRQGVSGRRRGGSAGGVRHLLFSERVLRWERDRDARRACSAVLPRSAEYALGHHHWGYSLERVPDEPQHPTRHVPRETIPQTPLVSQSLRSPAPSWARSTESHVQPPQTNAVSPSRVPQNAGHPHIPPVGQPHAGARHARSADAQRSHLSSLAQGRVAGRHATAGSLGGWSFNAGARPCRCFFFSVSFSFYGDTDGGGRERDGQRLPRLLHSD